MKYWLFVGSFAAMANSGGTSAKPDAARKCSPSGVKTYLLLSCLNSIYSSVDRGGIVIELGVDSFAANKPGDSVSSSDRMRNLVEEIVLADEVGLDAFGIGEHHREEFLDSAPSLILAAAATRTDRIRLASAVTVLSAADPVRVFQEFATLDLLSNGRAEIVAGRGSFIESFPLFGFELKDYDALFAEKLDLLLQLRDNPTPHWSGRFRPALTGQGVFPRPVQAKMPIWLGVGGTPASFARAGMMGLPLMIAIIGGEPHRFKPLVDLYRQAGARAGHAPETLKIGVHALGYIADTDEQAASDFFPGYAETFSKIGQERGWGPVTRAQFDALLGPTGALIVGSPGTVAEKLAHYDKVLGGIARLDFQMSVAGLDHAKLMRSIELAGSRVKPLLH